MKTITAKEAKNSFGKFLDMTQRAPVVVTKRSRPVGIFFAIEDVEALLGMGGSENHTNTKNSAEYMKKLKKKLEAKLS